MQWNRVPTLQGVLGKPYAWTYDGRLLVKVVPEGHPLEPPTKPLAPTGPAIQEADGSKKKAARTYQDLLRNQHDERVFEYYMSSELLLVEATATETIIKGKFPNAKPGTTLKEFTVR